MKKATKIFTIINYILSSILWILGFLTLLFNIIGLWAPWNIAGFGFVYYLIIPIIPQMFAIAIS